MTNKKRPASVRRRSVKKQFQPRDHEWGVDPDPQTNARIAEVVAEQFARRDYPVENGPKRNMWMVSWDFLTEKLLPGRKHGDYHFTIWLIDHPGKPARPADDIVSLIIKRKLIGNRAPQPLTALFGSKKPSAV